MKNISLNSIICIKPDTFLRYDNEGVTIIIPCRSGEPLLVNRTITDIIHFIEGENHSVNHIIEYLCKKYNKADSKTIEKDVFKVAQYLIEKNICIIKD